MNFRKNDVLHKDGRDLVLIDAVRHELTNHQSALVVFPLDEKNAIPEVWLREDLQYWFDEKLISVASRSVLQTVISKVPSAQKLQVRRWALIEGIVGNPELYFRSTRHKLLEAHARKMKSTPEHLWELLGFYWSRGQVIDALSGNYHRCGRIDPNSPHALNRERLGERGSRTATFLTSKGKSRGCKPRYFDYEPYNPPPDDARNILEVGCALFLKDETVSIRKTTDQVLDLLFSEKDENGNTLEDENGDAILLPLGKRPTEHQIAYRLRKALSDSERYRKRVTPHHHANKHAATLGTVLDDCNGPGDVYEIDATIVDCYIVADADEQTILGKCTLYMVVDRYTQLTVGFYLGLGSPSWAGAKLAFLSSFGDWEALCKRLGVVYRPEAFPAKGVRPNRIVADRGEMLSTKSNVLCEGMKIDVVNLPARRARWKGPGVELSFKLTHVSIKEDVPGYHPPKNALRRQGKKEYEESACLTLKQLTSVVLEVVQTRNLTILTGRKLTPEQSLKKLRATPANLWKEGLEESQGLLSGHDYAYARAQLLEVAEATVTQSGVLFKDLLYTFDGILERDWPAKASIRGGFPVPVRYSSESVNGILIQDKDDPANLIEAKLTTKSEAFKDLSFEEVAFLKNLETTLQKHGVERNRKKRIGSSNRLSRVTKPAFKKMKENAQGLGLGARKRDAVELREAQLLANRAQEHDLTRPGTHVGGGDMNEVEQEAPASTNAKPASTPSSTPRAPQSDLTSPPNKATRASSTLDLLFDDIHSN